MAEVVNFASLQKLHESLLQKQQKVPESNQQEFIQEVKEFIEKAKAGGSNISSTRERDQVRANLRYWANYIYSVDKTFPDTELAPSTLENRSISTIPLLSIIVVALILIAAGYFLFGRLNSATATEPPPSTEVPPTTEATEAPVETEVVTSPEATSTPESAGYNVTLSSPANGESITPNIEFKGTFDNLKPGWTIHVLLIRGDKYFPVKQDYEIPVDQTDNNWSIQSQLMETPEDMAKVQSYPIVLVVSRKPETKQFLESRSISLDVANPSETGIEINSLPDDIIPFDNTARIIYRNPFYVIREPRIVYSYFDGTSFDLYTRRLDGSDMRRITSTPDLDEMFPSLSPNGRQIVYVKRFHKETIESPILYTISIMDGNGANDNEIIPKSLNVLESPQWSTDAQFIAYASGDHSISRSPNETYWSILVHDKIHTDKEGVVVSGPPERLRDTNRYHSWIPNANFVVYNTLKTGVLKKSGFVQVSIDSLESPTLFFDTQEDDFQPHIVLFENKYLLTFIVNTENNLHDIYVAIDPDGALPFEGEYSRLVQSTGEDIRYPMLEPETNSLFYTKYGSVYRVEYQISNGKISLGKNPRLGGEVIVPAETFGDKVEPIPFDVKYMDTFFPLP